MTLAFVPISLARGESVGGSSLLTVIAALFFGSLYLGRIGRVNIGAWMILGLTILGALSYIALDNSQTSAPYFLVLAVFLAGILLPPTHIWSVLIACLISLGASQAILPQNLRESALWRETLANSALLVGMATLISFTGARGTHVALREAKAAREESENANRALAANNVTLEQRVTERTAALQAALGEAETAHGRLAEQLALTERQREVIREMSVPVLPINRDTLVMPLVGALDSARLAQIQAQALSRLEATRARRLLLDITGVPVVDTQVAQGLLRVVQAARLLGANVILVGIRPEVAQSIVGLGLDLSSIRTYSDLQGAMRRDK